jgi:archaemetzincin
MFPAPMMVPGHELAFDPDYPPQPVQEWFEADYRNKVTPERNTIYVAAPPKVPKGLSFVSKWTIPKSTDKVSLTGDATPTPAPSINDVVEYLQAFYHGMKVRLLTDPALEWLAWESPEKTRKSSKKSRRPSRNPDCVGLSNGKEIIRIESRPSPDGIFSGQLNQSHLLEVAIDILPKDAYGLLMLVHHDLFEDEDDDFCCGRACGGSRVAVVSMARYRPELDAKQEIDLEHVWPASHCARHVGRFFSNKTPAGPSEEQKHYSNALEYHPGSAIADAVVAHLELPLPSSPAELSALWLGRICKTASHELGHCFGIDHCVYWACSMQGTAHITEDHRQPPYLCPVDLSKVLRAAGADEKERYKALLKFCGRWKQDRMFTAYAAWIRTVLDHYELSS